MENELVCTTDLKQEWIDKIKSIILPQGFQEVEDGFERVSIVRQPGSTISINGRVMQQPGKEIEIRQNIVFVGDGWIADEDEETNKREFTQVIFEAYQGEELTLQHEESFYWDDVEYFLELYNHAYK